RGTADEALAALGQVSAQDEVELTACTADLLDAGGLGVDLTEEVEVDSVVDGYEVIDLRDGAGIIGVADRSAHTGRVVIDEVIELLGTCAECEGLTTAVDGLLRTGDLAGHGDVDESVNVHLGVNAEM